MERVWCAREERRRGEGTRCRGGGGDLVGRLKSALFSINSFAKLWYPLATAYTRAVRPRAAPPPPPRSAAVFHVDLSASESISCFTAAAWPWWMAQNKVCRARHGSRILRRLLSESSCFWREAES